MHTKLERLLSKSLTTMEVMAYDLVVHTGPEEEFVCTRSAQRASVPSFDYSVSSDINLWGEVKAGVCAYERVTAPAAGGCCAMGRVARYLCRVLHYVSITSTQLLAC